MTRLHDALDGIASRAPEIEVPRGLYRAARRRRRVKVVGAVLSVVAVIALVAPLTLSLGRTSSQVGDGGSGGLPDRLSMPPWWTSTLSAAPMGPAAVAFDGAVPQGDNEDFDLAWWRSGYTVYPSVVVGLNTDRYRIVRGSYSVGTELSPDGRYLLTPDRQVMDLTTGRARRVLPEKPHSPVAGAWSADGTRIVYVEDRVTTVLSWPSLRVQARFQHPDQVPVEQDVALSPDGSLLAVHSNRMLNVYRADGTRRWTLDEESDIDIGPPGNRLRIAGRAAWRPDGRLAVFSRTDLTCSDCGVHPGTWQLMFISDQGNEGVPGVIVGPSYPILKSALDVRIVAWHGEDAYAVVTWSRDGTGEPGQVGLIRLRPGEGAFDWVLKAPDGITSMQVATEFLDTTRPTGDPRYGFNVREAVGPAVTGALCLAPFVLVLVAFALLRRRARRQLSGIASG